MKQPKRKRSNNRQWPHLDRTPKRPGVSAQSDKISNGKLLVRDVSRNTVEYRRWKFVYEQWMARVPRSLEADTLARQLATAIVRREQLDTDVLNRKQVDPTALTRLCSLIARLTTKLETLVEAKAEQDKPKTFGQMLLENTP